MKNREVRAVLTDFAVRTRPSVQALRARVRIATQRTPSGKRVQEVRELGSLARRARGQVDLLLRALTPGADADAALLGVLAAVAASYRAIGDDIESLRRRCLEEAPTRPRRGLPMSEK